MASLSGGNYKRDIHDGSLCVTPTTVNYPKKAAKYRAIGTLLMVLIYIFIACDLNTTIAVLSTSA